MRVIFIRHGRLQSPYHNYDNLTFKELSQLARGDIQPSVDKVWLADRVPSFISTIFEDSLPSSLKLFYSPLKRAKQTANFIGRKLKVDNKNMIQLNELKEIVFNLPQIISEKAHKQGGMVAVRKAVFNSLITGNTVESLSSCFKRINTIEAKIKQINQGTVLCVTHGFFLRLLSLYFIKKIKRATEVDLTDLQEATNFDYLSSFSFIL